jgi:hypothetical protein
MTGSDSLETDEEVTQAPVTTPTARGFFDDVQLATPEQTLRRAALVFARRLPTDAELAAVRKDGESALPGLLRGLMTGEGFDMFVANGADEVLLMTAFQKNNIENEGIQLLGQGEHANIYPEALEMTWDWAKKYAGRDQEKFPGDWQFGRRGSNSLVLQPLELFKYVIGNERSYKEILTADYTMVNNILNKIYRSNVSGLPPYNVDIFESYETLQTDNSIYKFKPGKDNGRIFLHEHEKEEFEVTNSDGLRITYMRYISHSPFCKCATRRCIDYASIPTTVSFHRN